MRQRPAGKPPRSLHQEDRLPFLLHRRLSSARQISLAPLPELLLNHCGTSFRVVPMPLPELQQSVLPCQKRLPIILAEHLRTFPSCVLSVSRPPLCQL